METILKIVLTYSISYMAGKLLKTLRVPMGEIIGAVIAAASLNILTPYALFTSNCRLIVQFILGAAVGAGLSRDDVLHVRAMAKPFSLLMGGFVFLSITLTSIIYFNTDLDIPTSLLSSSPGGMGDMAMLAPSYGASQVYVSIIHVARAMFVLLFSPSIYRAVYKFATSTHAPKFLNELALLGDGEKQGHKPASVTYSKYAHYKTLLVAAIGGFTLKTIGVPAGGMIGAILATLIFNLRFGDCRVTPAMKRYARIGVGCYIGCCLQREFLSQLDTLIFPILVVLVGVTVFTILMAILISKLFKIDLVTAMMMCMPGGITEISVIADDFGADQATIMCMHSLRLISVIALFPYLIYLLEWVY